VAGSGTAAFSYVSTVKGKCLPEHQESDEAVPKEPECSGPGCFRLYNLAGAERFAYFRLRCIDHHFVTLKKTIS